MNQSPMAAFAVMLLDTLSPLGCGGGSGDGEAVGGDPSELGAMPFEDTREDLERTRPELVRLLQELSAEARTEYSFEIMTPVLEDLGGTVRGYCTNSNDFDNLVHGCT